MSGDRGDAVDADDGVTKLLAHPDIVRLTSSLESHKALRADMESGVRRAAVALIFRAGADGAPELLFIKRAEYPADPWSGQIAFPGGREEPTDGELIQTAVRETREETGLDLAAHCDQLTAALTHAAEVSAARLHRLLDPATTGLPAQLAHCEADVALLQG